MSSEVAREITTNCLTTTLKGRASNGSKKLLFLFEHGLGREKKSLFPYLRLNQTLLAKLFTI